MTMTMTVMMNMVVVVVVMMSMAVVVVVVGVELNSHLLTGLAECYLQCGRTEKVLITALLLPPPTHSFFCNLVVVIYKPAPSLLASRQGDERSKALQIARCGADLDLVFTTLAPIHMMQASFQPSS